MKLGTERYILSCLIYVQKWELIKSMSMFFSARNFHPSSVTMTPYQSYLFIHSRLKTKSCDPSLRAHTKKRSCHSTVCWSSPAAARSRPACTLRQRSGPVQMWRRTAALVRREEAQVRTSGNTTGTFCTRRAAFPFCWDIFLFPLTPRSWSEAQAHLPSSSLEPCTVPALGPVLTISH